MSTFRAKLRPPKRTLWLGCAIESVEMKRAKSNGRPYALVRFSNLPFVAIWSEFEHGALEQVLTERAVSLPKHDLVPGMLVHVDVRWELDPFGTGRQPFELYARARIDFNSVTDLYR